MKTEMYTWKFDIIRFVQLFLQSISHVYQKMHLRGLQTVHKFLHVAAPRRHPRRVSNTKEYNHQYMNMGSTVLNIKIIKNIKILYIL
jgi:hypothetical protein